MLGIVVQSANVSRQAMGTWEERIEQSSTRARLVPQRDCANTYSQYTTSLPSGQTAPGLFCAMCGSVCCLAETVCDRGVGHKLARHLTHCARLVWKRDILDNKTIPPCFACVNSTCLESEHQFRLDAPPVIGCSTRGVNFRLFIF